MANALLFDSTACGLSDITISVKSGEEVKTYQAHKAILANNSKWFYTLFSSDTAVDSIKLEENSLHHFDLLMKYFYNHDGRRAANDTFENLENAIGIYALAEKYESERVMDEAVTNFFVSSNCLDLDVNKKKTLVEAHYSQYSGSNNRMGPAIVNWLIECDSIHAFRDSFINSAECDELIKKYGEFAKDLIMVARVHEFQLF